MLLVRAIARKINHQLRCAKLFTSEIPTRIISCGVAHYDIIIIGGGAAGFFGAVNAARLGPGKRVAILEKSNKLLKLKVDTGVDQRTILSGIALHYAPEDLIGKQVTIVANLAPRKMMGIESQGMILMAENPDGVLAFVAPVNEIANGGMVK